MKKILLTTILGLSIAISSFAQSGTIGPLSWNISGGTLTISGTGDMPNYDSNSSYPWFWYNASIQFVVISEGVTSIEDRAFYNYFHLTSITIPNSVTSIGRMAFYNCGSLGSITISNSVTSIEDRAFYGTAWYENQPDGIIYISNVLYSYKGTMPENTSIQVKEGTASISDEAFVGCNGLSSISIPNSVKSIGRYAFVNCTSLTNITVESGNKNYTSENGLLYNENKTELLVCPGGKSGAITIPNSVVSIEERAFGNCSSLVSIIIPNGVTTIEDYTFYACTNLASITIPNSVTTIGNFAFYYCSSLASITIPNGVTTIGAYAFYGTAWYENQPDGIIYINDALYSYKGTMPEGTSIQIKEGTAFISDYAFSRCSGLSSISIPNSVKSIGHSAFSDCTSLGSITIPNGVVSIEDGVFGSCSSLVSISIPNSVTSIGDGAFRSCGSLVSIIIPNSVTSIGEWAFSNCTSLTSITLSNSCNTIGLGAFGGCTSLDSITFPNGVTTIGDGAFILCYDLTSVSIPNSVTTIGERAFRDCRSLTDIYSHATYPPDVYDETTFGSVNKSTCTLHVPVGSKQRYEAADGWKEFVNIVEDATMDIATIAASEKIGIYPNPVKESFQLTGITDATAITIFDASGNAVINKDVSPSENIAVDNLPAGMYLVQVGGKTLKLIKN